VRGCDAAGIKNPADYCARLKESRPEAEAFFQSFRVTYSRFFREPLLFAFLDQWIIPGIVRRAPPGSEIRVWSAGCACGQEAYSLAMLLDEQLQSSGKGCAIGFLQRTFPERRWRQRRAGYMLRLT
jgi:chemotaxis methyl-accepting protein methylase